MPEKRMIVTSVSGTNSSGKTSLIRWLIGQLSAMEKSSAVIVNEHGSEQYDENFINNHNLSVEGLRGGCVGCTLAGPFIGILKDYAGRIKPDYAFVEPSEMVVTYRLRNVLKMAGRDLKFNVGPLIALVDGPGFGLNWNERNKALLNHIQEADLVAISRCDMLGPEAVDRIQANLAGHHDRIVPISVRQETGLDRIMSLYQE